MSCWDQSVKMFSQKKTEFGHNDSYKSASTW